MALTFEGKRALKDWRLERAQGHKTRRSPSSAACSKSEIAQVGRGFFLLAYYNDHPREGATPLPRRAQPVLLLFRSNPPH